MKMNGQKTVIRRFTGKVGTSGGSCGFIGTLACGAHI